MLMLFVLFGISSALDVGNIIFVILSQENKFHLQQALKLKENITQQSQTLYKRNVVVHLSHRDFPHIGGWTVLPLIPRLLDTHQNNISWVFFLEDFTRIRLKELLTVLDNYPPDEGIWIGHALHDKEATIIHHFAFHENPTFFSYPNMGSGVAMSIALLKQLSERLERNLPPTSDFSIDSSHELALFIWNKGAGKMLEHEPTLCIKEQPHCASFLVTYENCNNTTHNLDIYFAVKTCGKFHKSRLPIIKQTWGTYTGNIFFFSELEDGNIPTVGLNLSNTNRGHCEKTMAILRKIVDKLKKQDMFKWIVLVDDDTILSVSALHNLLSCYNTSEPTAIGQRYGYNVAEVEASGYNYLTGGAGVVFTWKVVKDLATECQCPAVDAPDDMVLGMCLRKIGVKLTHSPAFHQARPIDYAQGYLDSTISVSFHKHWMIDPVKVYKEWFQEEDEKFFLATQRMKIHNEL